MILKKGVKVDCEDWKLATVVVRGARKTNYIFTKKKIIIKFTFYLSHEKNSACEICRTKKNINYNRTETKRYLFNVSI